MNFLKSFLTKLTTLSGRSTNSSNIVPTSATIQKTSIKKPILTDHFTIMRNESDNPYIITIYDRAFNIIKKHNDRVLRTSMFCYRSGDFYILNVELVLPKTYIFSTDNDASNPKTRAIYVLDMSHDRIIQKDDFDALKTVFETLKTRKPHQNDYEERKYLYHITTILLAAAEPGGDFIEPNGGERFPEEVDFPKYTICGDSLIYTWYELSTGMAYYIIKHTLIWDGKTTTHQRTEIDMSAPQKMWQKPDNPWR